MQESKKANIILPHKKDAKQIIKKLTDSCHSSGFFAKFLKKLFLIVSLNI